MKIFQQSDVLLLALLAAGLALFAFAALVMASTDKAEGFVIEGDDLQLLGLWSAAPSGESLIGRVEKLLFCIFTKIESTKKEKESMVHQPRGQLDLVLKETILV